MSNSWWPHGLRYLTISWSLPKFMFIELVMPFNHLMLKLKLQYFWSPDAKSWLIWKDPDAGKDWGQEEKGTTEDEMVGWHHRSNHGQIWVNSRSWWWIGRPGVQRGCKESDMTERLNWTDLAMKPDPYLWPSLPLCLQWDLSEKSLDALTDLNFGSFPFFSDIVMNGILSLIKNLIKTPFFSSSSWSPGWWEYLF